MGKIAGLRRIAATRMARIRLGAAGVAVGRGVTFHGQPIVTGAARGNIAIGDGATITSISAATALGVRGPTILRCLTPSARISIGAGTGISGAAICAAKEIVIGARCNIGADCLIFDTDFHNREPARRRDVPDWDALSVPVRIGDEVFLGTRVIVGKGVTIGHGSIVAAGSVVVGDVPPMTVFGGVPAKQIGVV